MVRTCCTTDDAAGTHMDIDMARHTPMSIRTRSKHAHVHSQLIAAFTLFAVLRLLWSFLSLGSGAFCGVRMFRRGCNLHQRGMVDRIFS